MIPFASSRGHGQDLATHLQKEFDNEYIEVAEISGAIADDLHGAFAEWEAQASALTRCENYLYSLSINPDQKTNGPLTRAQYDGYIARVEQSLGLAGQPRAVVFHIKNEREHCHVVWSRIDMVQEKAIHLSYDREKLMMVTRQFAREHDLTLAPGYHREPDQEQRKSRQLSLYEKHQQDSTGLTKEQRKAQVTEAWQQSDSPLAFVQALADSGYVLATGKRPYVVVDLYGHVNALPKLIDDRQVRSKDVCAFLERDFATDTLPSVEEAQEMAAEHRKALETFKASERHADQRELLRKQQAERRRELEGKIEAQRARQKGERLKLEASQLDERRALKSGYLDEVRAVRAQREANRPTGLAAFLGRVTGIELITKKVHRYQDKQRFDAFQEQKQQLQFEQDANRLEQQRAQEMQALELERKRRALEQTERSELRNLETTAQKEQMMRARGGHEHMPPLTLELRRGGRRAVPYKAASRYTSELARATAHERRNLQSGAAEPPTELKDEFARSAELPETPAVAEQSANLRGSDSRRDSTESIPKASGEFYEANKDGRSRDHR